LQRFEGFRRQQPAVEHALINQLAAQADTTALGGKLAPALANRLRISRAEASRRIHEAADLGERRALNGEPLEPVLPATAAAQRNGELGAGHVAVIRSFFQLYHTKRLASPAQRIVLYAKDRGCTFPGYLCEVHHCDPYATNPVTDINGLTFACCPNHKLAEQGWTARKNARGDTEWIPPPHLDHGQPRTNTFHHPEKLLRAEEDDDEESE
jgi:hypothetical protein